MDCTSNIYLIKIGMSQKTFTVVVKGKTVKKENRRKKQKKTKEQQFSNNNNKNDSFLQPHKSLNSVKSKCSFWIIYNIMKFLR